MKFSNTNRGFALVTFQDLYANECSIQKSSLATKDALWLGCNDGRMHIDRKMAKKLVKLLRHFIKTGDLPEPDVTLAEVLAEGKNIADQVVGQKTVSRTCHGCGHPWNGIGPPDGINSERGAAVPIVGYADVTH